MDRERLFGALVAVSSVAAGGALGAYLMITPEAAKAVYYACIAICVVCALVGIAIFIWPSSIRRVAKMSAGIFIGPDVKLIGPSNFSGNETIGPPGTNGVEIHARHIEGELNVTNNRTIIEGPGAAPIPHTEPTPAATERPVLPGDPPVTFGKVKGVAWLTSRLRRSGR